MEWHERRDKLHLVGWDTVRTPIANGGLGIRKLTTINKTLLGQWLWQFGMGVTRLLMYVVALKFGEEWGDGTRSWLRASMVEWPLEGYSDGLGDLKPAYLF